MSLNLSIPSSIVTGVWDAIGRTETGRKNYTCRSGSGRYLHSVYLKRGSVPKYQVYNNALLTAYKGHSFLADRTDTMLWERWVESAIGAHFLSVAEEQDYKVYYWREPSRNKDKCDKEVDFIIDNDGELTAIEVKSGRRGMNSGLPAFVEAFHPKQAFVVGKGGVSLEDFLNCDIESLLNQ